ncbi:DISARM system helicase DrmA [Stomatohabitans albus]|uniref:DISARM system helicase DrmA n=1 Tax=Stomatohabitans albus TaxID=3110766 RepID=UPI00300C338C
MHERQAAHDEREEHPSVWALHVNQTAQVVRYVITVPHHVPQLQQLQTGDGVILTLAGVARTVGRVYRVRTFADRTEVFLSAHQALPRPVPITPPDTLATTGAALTTPDVATVRGVFDAIGLDTIADLDTIDANDPRDQAYIRSLLTSTLADDLLGPALGPTEEVIGVPVRERYLIGKLAPRDTRPDTDVIHSTNPSDASDKDDPLHDEDTTTPQSILPSSMGLTFAVPASVDTLTVQAQWGHYRRVESQDSSEPANGDAYRWVREPAGGNVSITLTPDTQLDPIIPDARYEDVRITGAISRVQPNDSKLVTLFLVNTHTKPHTNQDEAWVFQPHLRVTSPTNAPIFISRPPQRDLTNDEEAHNLNMVYRNRVEFAVGHGVSVHATLAPTNPTQATALETTFLPTFEVHVTEPPGLDNTDRPAMRTMTQLKFFDMAHLAALATPAKRDALIDGLTYLVDDYDRWIQAMRGRIGNDLIGHDMSAADAYTRCLRVRDRLRAGIQVLATDDNALNAFRFTNAAMASQRIQSQLALNTRRGTPVDRDTIDIPKNRSWRPFQLAFVLLSIPSLADPTHHERTGDDAHMIADLLWFPTGGGKTEAYLGVAAFAMAIRRLHHNLGDVDGSRGLAVIMRYTLRLLTLQQFQRASALICAMEVLRRDDPNTWGHTPFTIGLWVGGSTTPNRFKQSKQWLAAKQARRKAGKGSPAQLTACPWCGSTITPTTDFTIDSGHERTYMYCPEQHGPCPFGRSEHNYQGLPVLVVDEEIYHHPPSILIATVDKFAQMAWAGQVATLFGNARKSCERHGLVWEGNGCNTYHHATKDLPEAQVMPISPIRPPDLIIQDEFHLISGPLGTLVGLYETAVDALCSWSLDGQTVRPKVVASTATVRKADEQIRRVFAREVTIFPPNGIDIEDNFFAVQRPTTAKPGRLYLGICPMGISRPASLSRMYTTLLTAGQHLLDAFGPAADPYMTLVGYFNALRELGATSRLCKDDISARAKRVTNGSTVRPGLERRYVDRVRELTSRIDNADIPKYLDHLEQPFLGEHPSTTTETKKPIDVVLATNMLSVGVDVNRIGLMVVSGQPKTVSEYIQATSRVGRAFPGLVCTVLNWSRPRDLSHFERFEHFHQSFYKHVEAQSVTPFSTRALDRGLTGVLVSGLRMRHHELNHNNDAHVLTHTTKPLADAMAELITKRAQRINGEHVSGLIKTMLDARIETWINRAESSNKHLAYNNAKAGPEYALLATPGVAAWQPFTVPNSMREVEAPITLVINTGNPINQEPAWTSQEIQDNDGA